MRESQRHGQNVVARLPRRRLRANKDYLSTVTNADLNRVLNEPQYSPLPTLSVRFASVINCNTRHAGQKKLVLCPRNFLLQRTAILSIAHLSVRFASVINCNTRHAGQKKLILCPRNFLYCARILKRISWD